MNTKQIFENFRMKQIWAEMDGPTQPSPRLKTIVAGKLEDEKQDALGPNRLSIPFVSSVVNGGRKSIDFLFSIV